MASPNHSKCDRVEKIRSRFLVRKKPENAPDKFSESGNVLPYGSEVNAPAITLPDVETFKTESEQKAAKLFGSKLSEIKRQYEDLIDLANDTELVNNSNFSFEPRVGHTYYLYEDGESNFLSLISPEEWDKFVFIGSFRYSSDGTWERYK